MTDIRERHVAGRLFTDDFGITRGICSCGAEQPCDAIREADRADKAEAALETMQEMEWSASAIARDAEAERDAAKAKANIIASEWTDHQTRCHDHDPDRTIALLRQRADKAEAALADECPDCGLSVAQVGRIHINAQMGHGDYLAAYARADKAEAAPQGAPAMTIEALVAEALQHVEDEDDLPDVLPTDQYATPAGQTLARWAAIGEAVERLATRPDGGIEWGNGTVSIWAGIGLADDPVDGTGPTITDAINAALGDEG